MNIAQLELAQHSISLQMPWAFACIRLYVSINTTVINLMASQNYAIVEFAVPYMALKAKRALDDVEASMRPDTSRRAEREAGGRVEQVKLLRSEFAAIKSVQSQFSRTLFVSNLPNVPPPAPCMHPAFILHVLCFFGRACRVSPVSG